MSRAGRRGGGGFQKAMKGRSWAAALCLIVGFLVVTPPAISGDSCVGERPRYVAGDYWVYSRKGERYALAFLRYDGNSVVERRTMNGNTRLLYSSLDGNPTRMTTEDGSVAEDYDGEIPRLRFPLRAGASWSGSYKTSAGVRRTISARVVACEDVIVVAGTFFSFRIEIMNKRADRDRPAYETLWYAPGAKRMVKHSSTELAIDTELTEYVAAPSKRE